MVLFPPHINQATLWRCALGEITSSEVPANVTEHLKECESCRQTLNVIYQSIKAPKWRRGARPPVAQPPAAVQTQTAA